MDCEQAVADSQGRRWFEVKAFMITSLMTQVAPSPGWEADITQSSNPAPPYTSGGCLRKGAEEASSLANPRRRQVEAL